MRSALPLLALLSACCAPPQGTGEGREAGALELERPEHPRVLVRFRRGLELGPFEAAGRPARRGLIAALRADASVAQARAVAILAKHGLVPLRRLWLANALEVSAPGEVLSALRALPEVEEIQEDLKIPAPPNQVSASSAPAAWNLDALRARQLWSLGHRGAGVVVALLDTGVDGKHPDLAPRWRSAAGWFDPHQQHPAPADLSGHGTQALGLILGGSAGGSPIGVAPDAQWIAARIFDDSGETSLAAIHAALEWVLDPDGDPATDDAADVVNGSWGFADLVGQCYLELEPDLAALRAARVALAFAAGNEGPGPQTSTSPANNPSSFSVGAIDLSRNLEGSSSQGPDACGGGIFPRLVAPGVDVKTADLTSGGAFPSSYVAVSGTSAAAPHIAGAFALLLSAHPQATVAQLEQALTTTALDLGAPGADTGYGHGLPDLVAAEAALASLVAKNQILATLAKFPRKTLQPSAELLYSSSWNFSIR